MEAARRPFIARRPHTKSRKACSLCKQRKVKCSETQPSCELCSGKGLKCEYIQPQKLRSTQKHPEHFISVSSPPRPLPTTFTMSDLRLFHHFLLHASPHHPLGNEKVWIQDIPALAHHHEFLMHAILGLAASNLTTISNANLSGAAISHRVDALRGVKNAMEYQNNSVSCTDAMLAAFYVFGFQALYIDDGLIDFLVMIRGCTLISAQIKLEGLTTVFNFPQLESYTQTVDRGMADMPYVSYEVAFAAFESLQALKPLCTHEVELLILNQLENLAIQMQSSVTGAYSHFMALYATIAGFSPEQFLYLTDSSQKTAQLLLGHFVAVHVLAGPLIVQEGFRCKKLLGVQKITKWLDAVVANVGPEQVHFLGWPTAVARMETSAHTQSYF